MGTLEQSFEETIHRENDGEEASALDWFSLEKTKSWLGSEFLTWLFAVSVGNEGHFEDESGKYSLTFSEKITIALNGNSQRHDGSALADDDYFISYILSGYHIVSANLIIVLQGASNTGEDLSFKVVLTKEGVCPKSIKFDANLEEGDRVEMFFRIIAIIETLYGEFIQLRLKNPQSIIDKIRSLSVGADL